MLKLVCLAKRSRDSVEDPASTKMAPLFEMTSNGLVCLMLASKVQDSDMHLKVANVVQLLRKFIDDNPGQLECRHSVENGVTLTAAAAAADAS